MPLLPRPRRGSALAMARLLRALAAALLLAAVAVADDGWFPADFLCLGLVPAEVLWAVGSALLERDEDSEAGRGCLCLVVLVLVLVLCWYFISAAARMRPLLALGGVVFVYSCLLSLLVKYLVNLIPPPVRSSIFYSLLMLSLGLGSSFCSCSAAANRAS